MMADSRPRDLFFALIVFTTLVIGVTTIIGEFQNEKPTLIGNTTTYSEFENAVDQYDSVTERIDTLRDALANDPEETGGLLSLFGPLGNLINIAWTAIKTLPSLLLGGAGLVTGILEGIAGYFGIPTKFVVLAIAFVTVGFIFALISAIFQRDV